MPNLSWPEILKLNHLLRAQAVREAVYSALPQLPCPMETREFVDHIGGREPYGYEVAKALHKLAKRTQGLTTRGTTPNHFGFLPYIWAPMTAEHLATLKTEGIRRTEAPPHSVNTEAQSVETVSHSDLLGQLAQNRDKIAALGTQLAEYQARVERLLKERCIK